MARPGVSEELLAELERRATSALSGPRRVAGQRQQEQDLAWAAAGERLAERAITALDRDDAAQADRLVPRMIALPVVQDERGGAGAVAVNQLLYREVLPIDHELDRPVLRLDEALGELDGLDGTAAAEVRHVLAASTDYALPRAILTRLRSVVDLDAKHDRPFQGERDPELLVPAVLAVLGVIGRLRASPVRSLGSAS